MGRKDREFNDWTDSLETSLKNCIQCNTPSNKHLLKFSFISSPVKAKSGEQKPCHWKEKKNHSISESQSVFRIFHVRMVTPDNIFIVK